ncbi:MAG: hypothetical protein ACI9ES_001049 [Oceanospirillaceae bacterium]|jgi:hypothetical protein
MSFIDQAFSYLVDLAEYLEGDKRVNITCVNDHYHFGVKADGTLLRYLDEKEKVGLQTDIGLIKMALFEGMKGTGAIIVRQYNASEIQLGEYKVVIDHVCGGRLTQSGIRPLSGNEMRNAYKVPPQATQFIDMPANHILKEHFSKLDLAAQSKQEPQPPTVDQTEERRSENRRKEQNDRRDENS